MKSFIPKFSERFCDSRKIREDRETRRYYGGAGGITTPLPNALGHRRRLDPGTGLEWYEPVDKHYMSAVLASFPC